MANVSKIKLGDYVYDIRDAAVPSHVKSITQNDINSWDGKQDAITAGNGIAIDSSDIIRTTGIPFGTCDSTSTSKVFTATVPGIYKLEDGVCCIIKNGVVTSESGFTLNVNGLGAKPSYSNMATGNDVTPTDPTRDTTIFNINYAMLFVYSSTIVDGGGWICYRGYDANTNTIGYQLRHNSSTLPASDKFYRYRLLFTSADGTKYVPANTSSSTNGTASRTVNLRPIDPFGEIVYYSSTSSVNAGANPAATVLWDEYVLNLGYSFNRTGAALVLTYPKPVYIKCTPQTDGSAIIDEDTPYVQALPTSADIDHIYIFLGIAYSATNIELLPNHPVYYHDGTGIRIWTGKNITKVSELTNDSGFITSSSLNGLASTSYVDTKVAGVVNSAPETLDTLKELASALGNDPNFATTVATSLGNKANTADLADVAFSGDYSDLDNTPPIPDELADLSDDSTHRLVTDTEKTNWNKQKEIIVINITENSHSFADVNGNTLTDAQVMALLLDSNKDVILYYSGYLYTITYVDGGSYYFSAFAGDEGVSYNIVLQVSSDSTLDVTNEQLQYQLLTANLVRHTNPESTTVIADVPTKQVKPTIYVEIRPVSRYNQEKRLILKGANLFINNSDYIPILLRKSKKRNGKGWHFYGKYYNYDSPERGAGITIEDAIVTGDSFNSTSIEKCIKVNGNFNITLELPQVHKYPSSVELIDFRNISDYDAYDDITWRVPHGKNQRDLLVIQFGTLKTKRSFTALWGLAFIKKLDLPHTATERVDVSKLVTLIAEFNLRYIWGYNDIKIVVSI